MKVALQMRNKKKLKKNKQMNFPKLYKKLISFLVIPFTFFYLSCSNNYCDKITKTIIEKQEFSKEDIVLDLNEIFDFEWDTLYICGPYGFNQEISKSIGYDTRFNYVSEGEILFAFIEKNVIVEEKLIYCENISFFNENPNESECIKIKSSDAKFKIKKTSETNQSFLLIR